MPDRPQRQSILVLTQFYAPEPCAAANRVGALIDGLIAAGFSVEVVTGFANFPSGIIAKSDRTLFRTEAAGEGLRLSRVFTYASDKISGRSRILNWLSVAFAMTLFVTFARRRFDFVIVTTPPITLAIPAFAALIKYRSKLIVDVRDVFPDVAIKMGYWRENSFVARTVGLISSALYRFGKLTFCVTEAARAEIIARGADPVKVRLVANGFDGVELATTSPYTRLPEEFVVVFVGNMGLATGLDSLIDAAGCLRDEPRIKFVLAGGGVDQDRLARRIAEERLANVTMLGVVTRPEANALIAAADFSLVPLHPGIVDSMPTKIYDALVLGCPVVCCANGAARAFIELSGGGVTVAPGDGDALAATLRDLLAHPEQRAAYADSGKAFVLAQYDRSKIMRNAAEMLARL